MSYDPNYGEFDAELDAIARDYSVVSDSCEWLISKVVTAKSFEEVETYTAKLQLDYALANELSVRINRLLD